MKDLICTILASAGFITTCLTSSVPWERLDKDNSVLLILDLQDGLYGLARDFGPTVYHNAMIAHSAIGQIFDLSVVMTTSAQQGPNGPLPREILDMYPDAPLIMRQGEVNAWDNPEFRAAIKATGKKQVIIGGIVTDVCTTFLALSLHAEGYSGWANVEASGTTIQFIRDVSNDRMASAGVQMVSPLSIGCDLMRDWRNTPGSATVLPWLAKYYPVYGKVAQAHGGAVLNGSLAPGEMGLLPKE